MLRIPVHLPGIRCGGDLRERCHGAIRLALFEVAFICASVGPRGRELAAGLNKYAGYFARGVTALLTGYLASR